MSSSQDTGCGHTSGETVSHHAVKAIDALNAQETKRRWLLLSPAVTIITLAAAGPLLIVLLYSFLEKGSYAGVIWNYSGEAWF